MRFAGMITFDVFVAATAADRDSLLLANQLSPFKRNGAAFGHDGSLVTQTDAKPPETNGKSPMRPIRKVPATTAKR
jgi:hypothetical protein